MRFSEIEKLQVKNKSGKKLGKVFDIQASFSKNGFKIKEIHFGASGMLERLGILKKGERAIDWKDIIKMTDDALIVNEHKVRNKDK